MSCHLRHGDAVAPAVRAELADQVWDVLTCAGQAGHQEVVERAWPLWTQLRQTSTAPPADIAAPDDGSNR